MSNLEKLLCYYDETVKNQRKRAERILIGRIGKSDFKRPGSQTTLVQSILRICANFSTGFE